MKIYIRTVSSLLIILLAGCTTTSKGALIPSGNVELSDRLFKVHWTAASEDHTINSEGFIRKKEARFEKWLFELALNGYPHTQNLLASADADGVINLVLTIFRNDNISIPKRYEDTFKILVTNMAIGIPYSFTRYMEVESNEGNKFWKIDISVNREK